MNIRIVIDDQYSRVLRHCHEGIISRSRSGLAPRSVQIAQTGWLLAKVLHQHNVVLVLIGLSEHQLAPVRSNAKPDACDFFQAAQRHDVFARQIEKLKALLGGGPTVPLALAQSKMPSLNGCDR
jgi:hypothetical protein